MLINITNLLLLKVLENLSCSQFIIAKTKSLLVHYPCDLLNPEELKIKKKTHNLLIIKHGT